MENFESEEILISEICDSEVVTCDKNYAKDRCAKIFSRYLSLE